MNRKNAGGRDPLEKIFLLAGRRKPVDPQRTDHIEQKTRERWQMMLARRRVAQRRRRFTLIGGGLAFATSVAAAVIFMSRLGIDAPMVATVVNVVGTPETGARGYAMTTPRVGDQLHAGSVLETAGDDGIALQLASGHSLRLAAASRVRIETDSVVLDAGALYLDSGVDERATPIEMRSRLATVRELGTQYMAQLTGDSLEVTVREGAVSISQGKVVATANAGELLQLDESGQTRRLFVPEHGEHWAWVTQLAPMPVLEGLTLAEFLHWLAREQGWQLEFATPELARYAATVELHGSIDGLSGEEALAAVITTTGWRYKLTNGVLTVDSRGDERR
jgi:ferric-dicitrate binding protein FerR (iron transport regulator)